MLEDDDEVGSSIVAIVEDLLTKSNTRRALLECWRCMYIDEPMPDGAPADTAFERGMRTRWPALRSGVDSVHSRIAKSRPRVQVLTIDGDYELSTRADNLTMYIDGEFDRLNIYELMERCFLDAEVYGRGWLHFFEKFETDEDGKRTGRTACERVYEGDMFTDPVEEEHDCIRSRYRIKWVDRFVLAEAYPKHAEKILAIKAPDPMLRKHTRGAGESDTILVVEGWHLPLSKTKPGRHVIACDDCVLVKEPWTDDTFPFAQVYWARDPASDRGIGLVAQMAGPQRELDEYAEVEHENRALFVPSAWLSGGDEVDSSEINNAPGTVYKTTAGTIQLFDPTACVLNMQRVVDIMIERVHNLAGVSVLSAQSEKPSGVTSGVALNSLHNIESERFAMASRSYERLGVDAGKQIIASAERLARAKVSPKTLQTYGSEDDAMSEVTFEDARFGERPYQIRTFAASSLSTQPAAKMEEVMTAINAGWVDKEDGGDLLGFPDFKRHVSIVSAGRRMVKKAVELALRKGEATPPDPYWPLDYMIRYGTLARDDAQRKNCPPSRLRVLEDMIGAAQQMQARAAIAAQPMAGMPAGGPGAQMAPPAIPAMPAGPGLAVVPPGA